MKADPRNRLDQATDGDLEAQEKLSAAGFQKGYQALYLENDQGEAILAIAAAKGIKENRRGLLGQAQLDRGVGLLLSRAPFIHSVGMQFPFDAVWIRQGRVVRVKSSIKPGRILLAGPAWQCLELAEGQAVKLGLKKGEMVEFKRA